MIRKVHATLRLLRVAFAASPGRAAAVVASALSGTVAAAVVAAAVRSLVNGIAATDRLELVQPVAVLLGCLFCIQATSWAGFILRVGLQERTLLALNVELLTLVARHPGVEHVEDPKYLRELDLLGSEHESLASLPATVTRTLAAVVRLGLTSVLLASVDLRLLALPLFGIPSVAAASAATRRRRRVAEEGAEHRRLQWDLHSLGMSARAAKEVRLFGVGTAIVERTEAARAVVDAAERRSGLRIARDAALSANLYSAALAVAVWVLATDSGMDPGSAAMVLLLGVQLNGQVANVAGGSGQLSSLAVSAQRYLWLREVDRWRSANRTASPATISTGIELCGVGFRYPASGRSALADVSLSLPAGSVVALVGENGAGKSTVVKLLCGLYQPTTGRILIDDVDVADLDPDTVRAACSGVFQDTYPFELRAQQVIGIGDLALIDDHAAVAAAVVRAGVGTVVDRLPSGLDTQLGRSFEGGYEPSRGMWQQLALARSMMRPTPMLTVLDEPAAALDPAAEEVLFQRYAQDRPGVTVLVSHRFSTVRFADLIIVLHQGRVVEQGTHHDLLAADGRYAGLYRAQARGYQ